MATRGKWTTQEEEFVKQLRERENIQSWKEIAEKLNQYFPDMCMSGKQCRERYINYVRFSEENTKSPIWTTEDDKIFMNLFLQYGAKWASIVKSMPYKSENCLKNRFYGGLRRIIRKINRVEKQHRIRKTKPIRYETLIRVLNYEQPQKEEGSQTPRQNNDFCDFLLQLKTNILQSTWDLLNGEESDERIILVIQGIHEFNARIRGLKFKPLEVLKKRAEKARKPRGRKPKKIEYLETEAPEKSSNDEECSQNREFFNEHKMEEEEKPLSIWENTEDFFGAEIKQLSPPIQKLTNLGDLDYELSRIFQQDYVPQTFSFFQ